MKAVLRRLHRANFLSLLRFQTQNWELLVADGCAATQRDPDKLEKWAGQEFWGAQQRKVQSPASGEEQPHVPGRTGDLLPAKLCRKSHGTPGGQQINQEPATCPCGKGGQQPPGLCCQQVEGGGGSSLPSSGTGEARTDWSESGEGL